jgi:hypothetical protein
MTAAQRHLGEPPVQFRPASDPPPWLPRAKARLPLWFHLLACLLIWPVVFSTIVIATFVGVVFAYDTWAGPLFWPIAWILSAIFYGLFVGMPLALCGRSRRWYLRLVPAATAAAPFIAFGILVATGTAPATAEGLLWLIPAAGIIALSIVVQTSSWWRPRGEAPSASA